MCLFRDSGVLRRGEDVVSDLTQADLGPYTVSDIELDRLRKAHQWATEHLLGSGEVVGVGIGLKKKGGKTLSQVTVRVLVRRKLAADAVAPQALVPPQIEGVPTDVEEIGTPLPDAEDPTAQYRHRHRPIVTGVSIGPAPTAEIPKPETGTLGCFVRAGEHRYIVSNNHVLAFCNETPKGTAIRQPGYSVDGGQESDQVGVLTAFWEMGFGAKGGSNKADVAVALVADDAAIDPRVLRNHSFEPLGANLVKPALNMRVQKSGRATGQTIGTITEVSTDIQMDYKDIRRFDPTKANLTDQFRVTGDNGEPFGKDGDSGSLVTTVDGNHPVGLLVGSDSSKPVSTCTPIEVVLQCVGKLLSSPVTIIRE
jgi:hypothetical protein